MAVKLQFRRDTAANWESNNPVLSEGELGLDLTNDRFKIGDGVSTWNNIEFSQYTNKAETFEATFTIAGNDGNGASDWSLESGGDWNGFYSVTKTVTGLLADDNPFIDVDLSNATALTFEALQTEFLKIIRATVTGINTIKFYAGEELELDIPINLKVVR